jgi:hypothetical protein
MARRVWSGGSTARLRGGRRGRRSPSTAVIIWFRRRGILCVCTRKQKIDYFDVRQVSNAIIMVRNVTQIRIFGTHAYHTLPYEYNEYHEY